MTMVFGRKLVMSWWCGSGACATMAQGKDDMDGGDNE